MARKNQEANGDACGKSQSVKYAYPSKVYVNNSISTSPKKCEKVFERLSPSRMQPQSGSPGSSPRTSPGLLAGHYAGCKWSEPPLPSALPRPPQHWMSAAPSATCPFLKETSKQPDITYQLKMLLNMQA